MDDTRKFVIMDLGEIRFAVGVVTQGRRDNGHWSTDIKVAVSLNKEHWLWPDGVGTVYSANHDRTSRVANRFAVGVVMAKCRSKAKVIETRSDEDRDSQIHDQLQDMARDSQPP